MTEATAQIMANHQYLVLSSAVLTAKVKDKILGPNSFKQRSRDGHRDKSGGHAEGMVREQERQGSSQYWLDAILKELLARQAGRLPSSPHLLFKPGAPTVHA